MNHNKRSYEEFISDIDLAISIQEMIDSTKHYLSYLETKRNRYYDKVGIPMWMCGCSSEGLKHLKEGAEEKHNQRFIDRIINQKEV